MGRSSGWIFVLLLVACGGRNTDGGGTPATTVMHGFTAFPYELSETVTDRVYDAILPHSNLVAIHRDSCLPWEAVLSAANFPVWFQRDIDDIKRRIPPTHTIYLAVTPTAPDRFSLAPNCGARESEDSPLPAELVGKQFDHARVKQAYYQYVLRMVDHFQPTYLNLGIEISELVLRKPELWSSYEALYDDVYVRLKAARPSLQIGAEFVLQSLLAPRVAQAVKPLVERSDYIGISFYPYGSDFGVALGAPALPAPPAQWREPLAFLRHFTSKPIGIAETGYTTKDIFLPGAKILFPGNEALQRDFLRDLIATATRDRYLFVVWFVPIDYERLLEQAPDLPEESHIWVNAGLFDRQQRAKPAWQEWLRLRRP